jgi:hypothetical protein
MRDIPAIARFNSVERFQLAFDTVIKSLALTGLAKGSGMPKDLMVQDAAALKARFLSVRGRSEAWVEGLSAEDLCVQTMDDVSPGKWHLAHVTWFWETFLAAAFVSRL